MRKRLFSLIAAGAALLASAPAEAAVEIPALSGSVAYADNWVEGEEPLGVYALPRKAGRDFTLQFLGPVGSNGVAVDGVYYSTIMNSFYGYVFVTVEAYDIETGDLLGTFDSNDGALSSPAGMAVDPTSGTVYGLFYNSDLSGYELGSVSYSPEAAVRTGTIATYAGTDYRFVAFAIDKNGEFYAVNAQVIMQDNMQYVVGSTLVKLDRDTGEVTEIGDTGQIPGYIAGAFIDPDTNRMFWCLSPADNTGYLTEVDLTTGVATKILDFPHQEEVVGLFIPAPLAAPKAPAKVENLTLTFQGSSLSGTATLTAPARLYDGSAPSGKCTITVTANDEVVATMPNVAYGASVSVPVTVPAQGLYNFFVYAENSEGRGPRERVKSLYVGNDVPKATTATLAYDGTKMNLTWQPVTESVNGGYVDYANVTYTVTRYPGGVKVADAISATEFSEVIAAPEDLTAYYYEVVADNAGVKSDIIRSNTVTLGSLRPPYEADLTQGIDGWTIIDANEDGRTWSVDEGHLRAIYSMTLPMDDWAIMPPMRLEEGENYELTFKTYAQSSPHYPERVEVKCGTAPTAEAMTMTVVAPTDVPNPAREPQLVSAIIRPEATGLYYIGFHGISDADKYYLHVYDIRVAAGVKENSPAAPSALTVTSDPDGALKAEVSVTAPSEAFDGSALTSLTKLEILRDGEVVKDFTNPAPGAELTYTDEVPARGEYTYTAVAYNASGRGVETSVKKYIGTDIPAAAETTTLARTATVGEAVVSWSPVSSDHNGNPINPALVKYDVYRFVDGEPVLIAADVAGTSHTFMAVEAGQQAFVQCGIIPKTEAGSGEGTVTENIPVGTPYNGLAESFANTTLTYEWGLDTSGGASVGIYADAPGTASQDGDDGFLGWNASNVGMYADVVSGLISLNGMEAPGATFYTLNITDDEGDPDINEIQVFAMEEGSDTWQEVFFSRVIDIANNSPEEIWAKARVDLGDYKGKTIQLKFRCTVKYFTYTMIDNIKVGELLPYDIVAAGISAPSNAKCGEPFEVEVRVNNDGSLTADRVALELYENDALAETVDVENLAASGSRAVKFQRTMPEIATEALSYYAVVKFSDDGDPDNNRTRTLTVAPVVSDLPTVTDLYAGQDEQGVTLTWSEPDLSATSGETVTQSFEDGDSFADSYGNWIFVDGDDSPAGGFQNVTLPNITPGMTKGSFWVMDVDVVSNSTFNPRTGKKCLFSLYRADNKKNDDWAISPALDGKAQQISFYAKSYHPDYPEKIEVLCSNGGTTPADFTTLLEPQDVPADWTLYTVDIPAGAKRFAIRNVATGAFMLLVDDVTFSPEGAAQDAEILGYNIYRNGEKLNTELYEERSFRDTSVVLGETYRYVVTVRYNKGVSAASNEVSLEYSAVAGIEADTDMDGELYTLSGIHLGRLSKLTHRPAPGVYLLRTATKTHKLILK